MGLTDYTKGDRVRLVRTSDPHTRLQVGTAGTVTRVSVDVDGGDKLHVDWDDGSTLAMLLDEGDQVSRILDTGGAS